MHIDTAKQMAHVTPRQMQILKAVASFQCSRCYSPTIAELARELGISRTTVFEHISELRRKGLLSALPGKARSLELTCEAQELLRRFDSDEPYRCDARSGGISLAGKIAAGEPLEAVETGDCISFASCFGAADEIFALEVKGDSMIDEGVREGDYVICRRCSVAENGQLVVAIVDNDCATLKRFYKEKERVRLQPANEDYQPIYSDNCRIEAVVVGLIRRLCAGRVV